MTEVVINAGFGGFSLSHRATVEYAKRKGLKLKWRADEISKKYYGEPTDPDNYKGIIHYSTGPDVEDKDYFSDSDIKRDDPDLVAVVKKLKGGANGRFANLNVVKVPDDVDWEIDEYDGRETVEEKHRSWA